MEKLKIDMNKIKEEEIKELPQEIKLNIEQNKNNFEENKNKNMNIEELLQIEDQNEQNFEYYHINENNETNEEKQKNIIKSEEIPKVKEIETPKIESYRQISILELIHDAAKFSPIFFTFLTLKDLLEFTSISKKIKRFYFR